MSRAKYSSTANSVPSWVTAVNDAPASSAKNTREAIARWPDDDTGKNSVSPCNTERTITCTHDIAGTSVTTTTVPWLLLPAWSWHRSRGGQGVTHCGR